MPHRAGDGVYFDYLGGAFDVVAHEMTHGVTEFTSGLGGRDEPGALNEAFSDIMAVGMEFFHLQPDRGPQRGPNFVVGEDVTRASPGFIRSLANPSLTGSPDHYSLRRHIGTTVDDGGVHVNSTIASHAFYLAVVGGTNRVSGISVQGIGLANMARMERVFYRAFTFFLGPESHFTDARAATLQAAAELYGAGSAERIQLQQAWTAVGVQ
jgi:thermolysin